MDRKCRNKQERKKSLAVSVACMAIYWPTPGFKRRTFKLCVLTRWDFNFCVRSSPLRGPPKGSTHNTNNIVNKIIRWEEQLRLRLKHKALQKKRNNYQENYEVLRRREPIRRKKVKTIKLNPWKGAGSEDQLLHSKGKANKKRHA